MVVGHPGWKCFEGLAQAQISFYQMILFPKKEKNKLKFQPNQLKNLS